MGKAMVPVARKNLLAEKGRFVISVAGVAFAVMLILIVVALYRGWSRAGQVFNDLPGQLWVVQQGTSDPFHSGSLLDPADVAAVESVDGVAVAVPVLSRQMNFSTGRSEQSVRLMALDFPPGSAPANLDQTFLPPEGVIIIERVLSRETGLNEGDQVDINGVRLVVGAVRPPGGDVLSQFAFVNFADARRIFGIDDIVNYAMVVLANGGNTAQVQQAIEDSSPRLQVYTADGFAKSVRKEVDESFLPIIVILVVIGFIVGVAVVGLTIYTATIERSREFGVMKAVGASGGFLYRIVLAQAGMLTIAGFVAGLAAAMITANLAERATPEFATQFQLQDGAAVFAAAVVMGVIASLVPVRRINSIDPALVFRA